MAPKAGRHGAPLTAMWAQLVRVPFWCLLDASFLDGYVIFSREGSLVIKVSSRAGDLP